MKRTCRFIVTRLKTAGEIEVAETKFEISYFLATLIKVLEYMLQSDGLGSAEDNLEQDRMHMLNAWYTSNKYRKYYYTS